MGQRDCVDPSEGLKVVSGEEVNEAEISDTPNRMNHPAPDHMALDIWRSASREDTKSEDEIDA